MSSHWSSEEGNAIPDRWDQSKVYKIEQELEKALFRYVETEQGNQIRREREREKEGEGRKEEMERVISFHPFLNSLHPGKL